MSKGNHSPHNYTSQSQGDLQHSNTSPALSDVSKVIDIFKSKNEETILYPCSGWNQDANFSILRREHYVQKV